MRSIPCLAFITLLLAACATGGSREDGVQPLRVASERTVTGFGFPESVGCDVEHNVLYVSQFGGTEPKPPAKDGLGYISKVAPDGTVIEKRAFDVTMNKPKGIWIQGTRLWVTDIDSLWIFDTVTKQSRRLEIPGMEFANDVALMDGAAYVSDNRNDELRALWKGGSIFPNGLWPTKEGLLMVGFQSADKPRGIYVMGRDGAITQMSQPIGRLDGLYQMRDRSLLVTDWNTGTLFRWSSEGGMQTLAKGFKGPADLCVMGDTVYVPDLVKGEIRIVRLAR
jgi:hypothetical protein